MFKKVGNKIKVISVLLLIAGILLSAYIGVFGHMLKGSSFTSDVDELIFGAVIIVAGVIASIVLSLIVNGFGVIVEKVENIDEIRDLLLEIKNKKTDFRSFDGNKKSASILNSSFNNEVYDDRDFSSEEPAAPEYVKPVSGHEVASSKFVSPNHTGKGNDHPTRPVFGTQNVGVDSMKPALGVDSMPDMPIRNSRPAPVPEPKYEEPMTSAFDEPVFDEPVQPAPRAPRYEAPVQPAPRVPQYEAPITSAFEEPVYEAPAPKAPQYEAPITSAFDEPVYEAPVQQAAPQPEEPAYEEEYEPGVYESPEVKVLTPEEQARANQIQELIFKFVARRNGSVNINDILRTVPRNVEPSEFQDAVKVLEEQGRFIKNEAGDYMVVK